MDVSYYWAIWQGGYIDYRYATALACVCVVVLFASRRVMKPLVDPKPLVDWRELKSRAEPTMPRAPLALAAAVVIARPRDHMGALMADLGVRGVLRWKATWDSLEDDRLLQAVVVDPAKTLHAKELRWLRAHVGRRPGEGARWRKVGALESAASAYERVVAETAVEDGLTAQRSPWRERVVGLLGAFAAVAFLVLMVPPIFRSLLFSWRPRTDPTLMPDWLAVGAFAAVFWVAFAGLDVLLTPWTSCHLELGPTADRRLAEIQGVEKMVNLVLAGEMQASAEDAQRLLPWAALFGRGEEWAARTLGKDAQPAWLEQSRLDNDRRFARFFEHPAFEPAPTDD